MKKPAIVKFIVNTFTRHHSTTATITAEFNPAEINPATLQQMVQETAVDYKKTIAKAWVHNIALPAIIADALKGTYSTRKAEVELPAEFLQDSELIAYAGYELLQNHGIYLTLEDKFQPTIATLRWFKRW